MDLATEFKHLLINQKMTISELAKQVGVSQSWMSKKFAKNDFKISDIESIANVLDYDVEIIFKKRENKE